MVDREKLVEAIQSEYFDASSRACDEPRRCVAAILTEIAAQGYVIVPREPTEAMWKAVREAWDNSPDDGGIELGERRRWSAMIEAEREGD